MKLSVGDKIFYNGNLCPIEETNEFSVIIACQNGLHKSIPLHALEGRTFEWIVEYHKGNGEKRFNGRSRCDTEEKAKKEKALMDELKWETTIHIEEKA